MTFSLQIMSAELHLEEMMGTKLHQLVASYAKTDPAIVISNRLLIDLLTRRLVVALSRFVGQYQQYPDVPAVQIGLASCSYQPKQANWKVTLPADGGSTGRFLIESTASFSARFGVTKAGDTSVGLFVVDLEVVRVSTTGAASKNMLALGEVHLDFRTTIVTDGNATANATALGLTDRDIARLEGLVAGSIAPTAVRKIFTGAPKIDLQKIFPTVQFTGAAELATIPDGLIIIAKNGWTLDEGQRCECGATAPEIVITPPERVEGEYDGTPLPVKVSIPPPRNPPWPVDTPVAADVGLYMPQATINALTDGPYPAINDYDEDNGFFGWTYDYSIGFSNVKASLKDSRATIVLTIDFYVTGTGTVNVDIPCVGRTTAGIFWAHNRTDGPSSITFGITPRLQPDGKIVLMPELLDLDIKPFSCECVIAALSALSFFGTVGTVAAFVINEIIRRMIAHNLPSLISSSVKDSMGKQMWTLLDLTKLDVGAIYGHNFGVREAFSREPDSLLVGLAPRDY